MNPKNTNLILAPLLGHRSHQGFPFDVGRKSGMGLGRQVRRTDFFYWPILDLGQDSGGIAIEVGEFEAESVSLTILQFKDSPVLHVFIGTKLVSRLHVAFLELLAVAFPVGIIEVDIDVFFLVKGKAVQGEFVDQLIV